MPLEPPDRAPAVAGEVRVSNGLAGFTSIGGKSNAAGIRWREDHAVWSGLTLQPLFDAKDKLRQDSARAILPG